VAREGVERGSKLASRLLALARTHLPEPRPADLSLLVGELLPFLRHAAGPGVAIRVERRAGPALCIVDPQQFNTALLNLVVNARDAMPGGGEIGIRTDEVRAGTCETATGVAQRHVRLRVADTGEGMAADVAARIFDAWFTTKGDTGTGLGLPQVRRFVSAAGGSVALFSEPGQGTVLDLFFPIDEDPPPDRDLSKQLDRWANEGGSSGGARPGP
jgi:signal transduction histidine kinase